MDGSELRTRVLASTSIDDKGGNSFEQKMRDESNRTPEDVEIEDKLRPERGSPENEALCDKDNDIHQEKSEARSIHRSGSFSETDSSSYASNPSSLDNSQAGKDTEDTPKYSVSCVHDMQLSPDGTCIFTTDYDRSLSVYVIHPDIMDEHSSRSLRPYSRLKSSDPIRAIAINPRFDLSDGSTTLVLVARRDQYISLHNGIWDLSNNPSSSTTKTPNEGPINISTRISSYKFINTLTEAVISPLSLTFTRDGTHFIAGHQNAFSIFDIQYTGGPILVVNTIPIKKLRTGALGFKGEISALSISSKTGKLAVGTRTRFVGIYAAEGFGELITHFELPKLEDSATSSGGGVSSLKWSPCGSYLYIAERMSDLIHIYDAKHFAISLRHCCGRNALTKQVLGFDVWSAGNGSASHEVWAGGMDGLVRVWRDPHLREGALDPDETIIVCDAPLVNTIVHPCGSLLAVAIGQREYGKQSKGKQRGGDGLQPRFKEWGRLDILGLHKS
ncbi:WD40-repeat-containing domain protein [Dendryphion nanum]|uniref:WD40-repeat-containing domain protein n=1 Tax=Dendryphion nanum TaxID=256645 RepID=A0A9P9E4S1_9PLEO|nr:WD40-repeat-containing domain protein [Dendryphion nanum]